MTALHQALRQYIAIRRALGTKMREPAVFFDTRNFFYGSEKDIKLAGFKYFGVGR